MNYPSFSAAVPIIIGGIASAVVIAGSIAAVNYDLAVSGQCGCELQQAMLRHTRAEVISRAGWRALGVALIFTGLALIPGGAETAIAGGVALSVTQVVQAATIIKNNNNLCTRLQLFMAVTGLVASSTIAGLAEANSVSASAAGSTVATEGAAVAEVEPISQAEGLARIAQIRQEIYGIGAERTVAYSENNVPGLPNELVAVSGKNPRPGTVVAPANRLFNTPAGYQYHAEVNLLEYIASRLTAGSSGTVRMFVEIPACQYCNAVIDQFEAMFPNIRLVPNWGPPRSY